MVVDYLDIFRSGSCPPEADAVLIIHSDAVLALPISTQRFQPVSRRDPQVLKGHRDLELPQLPARNLLYADELPDTLAARKRLSIGALERNDHGTIVTRRVINVKRDYRLTCWSYANALQTKLDNTGQH